jgi:hypothetical protein
MKAPEEYGLFFASRSGVCEPHERDIGFEYYSDVSGGLAQAQNVWPA